MGFKNTYSRFGIIAQFLHWVMALAVVGLFGLGLWMTSLDYYDPWYRTGPYLHEGAGVMVFAALVFRLYWRATNVMPDSSYLRPLERVGARIAHWGMYGLLAAVSISGYLISTGDGRPLPVFDLFSLPSVAEGKGLVDLAGKFHYYASIALIVIAALHMLAALKHHFVDRDDTLRRMLPARQPEN